VEHRFDEPVVTSGPVAFAGKHLADELLERLAANAMACTQMLVVAVTDHGERSERLWRHEPAFTAAAMAERVRWQLESGGLGSGARTTAWGSAGAPTAGIVVLRLVPTEVVAATGEQRGFWGGRTQADDRAQRAVARLVGVLGPEAVCRPEGRGGRSPLESVGLVPATLVSATPETAGTSGLRTTGLRNSRIVEPWPGHIPDPSPTTVLREPEPVQVLDTAGLPVWVSGRGILSAAPARIVTQDRSYTVAAWSAPWPIDERWWDPERARRCARMQIVTESAAAFLVVVEKGRWTIHATYD
jgi:protein ImuB